jgi:hypothetical protein
MHASPYLRRRASPLQTPPLGGLSFDPAPEWVVSFLNYILALSGCHL